MKSDILRPNSNAEDVFCCALLVDRAAVYMVKFARDLRIRDLLRYVNILSAVRF